MKYIHILLFGLILASCASYRDQNLTSNFQQQEGQRDHFSMVDSQASRVR